MPYTRPWKNRQDQLELLKGRGLEVSEDQTAKDQLAKIGYYRLSGYWYPFRQSVTDDEGTKVFDAFCPGAKFSDAFDLYVFDKKLRLLALDALERIEVAVRVEIAHLLGERDTFAHLNAASFDGKFVKARGRQPSIHDQWVSRYQSLLNRSKEEFIKHYKSTHGLPLPIWVSIEIWDFGSMSIIYSGLKGADRDSIARRLNVPDGRYLRSWLRSLNYLRNVCAHHSRLWNRNIIDQPTLPKGADAGDLLHVANPKMLARPFTLFCLIQWIMREISPNSQWHERFKAHLQAFPSDANNLCRIDQIGCPDGWEQWDLWK